MLHRHATHAVLGGQALFIEQAMTERQGPAVDLAAKVIFHLHVERERVFLVGLHHSITPTTFRSTPAAISQDLYMSVKYTVNDLYVKPRHRRGQCSLL